MNRLSPQPTCMASPEVIANRMSVWHVWCSVTFLCSEPMLQVSVNYIVNSFHAARLVEVSSASM